MHTSSAFTLTIHFETAANLFPRFSYRLKPVYRKRKKIIINFVLNVKFYVV